MDFRSLRWTMWISTKIQTNTWSTSLLTAWVGYLFSKFSIKKVFSLCSLKNDIMSTKTWTAGTAVSNQQIYVHRLELQSSVNPWQSAFWPQNAVGVIYSPVRSRMAAANSVLCRTFIVTTNQTPQALVTFLQARGVQCRSCVYTGFTLSYKVDDLSLEFNELVSLFPSQFGWFAITPNTQ